MMGFCIFTATKNGLRDQNEKLFWGGNQDFPKIKALKKFVLMS